MKSIYITAILAACFIFPPQLFSQTLVSATSQGTYLKAFITLTGLTNAEYDIEMFKVTYNTTDLNGNSVVASGMIAIPLSTTCDSLPIALYAHGTVLKRNEVPSANNQESILGKAIASRGYVTAMPDYLGLGDLPGLHPYQHAESEATASVDILRAAKEFIADSLSFTYSNEVFLTGYSQGGHAAMATTKYIQDNNLEAELNVVASAPLSGAFHASKRQTDELLLDIPYNSPGYIVYLIMSYQEAYGGIYSTPSDFLQSPYDVTVPPMFDGIMAISSVHAVLPNRTSQFLNSTFLNGFIADSAAKTSAVWQALLDNDNHDWTPNMPLKMFYCSGDQTVKPENTIDAYNAMIANGATQVFKEDLGSLLNHGGCVIPAINNAIDFFQTIRTDCVLPNSIVTSQTASNFMEVYPNPAINQIQVNIENGISGQLTVFDIAGREILQTEINTSKKLNVSNWKNGVYLLKVVSNDIQYTEKITIKH